MGNVADGIVDRLRAWGVRRVFGYVADGTGLQHLYHRAKQLLRLETDRATPLRPTSSTWACSPTRA